jgi:hypothetical protein
MKVDIKNGDYYVENGRVHFKEEYLLKKRQCCGVKCIHCPYNERIKGNTVLKKVT